jgi:hypothetical protein
MKGERTGWYNDAMRGGSSSAISIALRDTREMSRGGMRGRST